VCVEQPFQSFLMCLTEEEDDGRIALHRDEATGQAQLSYQLLNASAHFKEIVAKSHAVVLAGGTMQVLSLLALRVQQHKYSRRCCSQCPTMYSS
jgi:Rad3-related DNA helicase